MNTMAEIYVPDLQKTCSLGNMTMQRYEHTQDGFLACGGTEYLRENTGEYWTYDTCEVYVPGVGWRLENYILNTWKTGHTSWTLKNGSVLLLGSWLYPNSTEIVTPGEGTQPGFNLNNPIR